MLFRSSSAMAVSCCVRKHDHQFGWFDCVARRHGAHSIEVQQAQQLTAMAELRQLYLPGIPEVTSKRAKSKR